MEEEKGDGVAAGRAVVDEVQGNGVCVVCFCYVHRGCELLEAREFVRGDKINLIQ